MGRPKIMQIDENRYGSSIFKVPLPLVAALILVLAQTLCLSRSLVFGEEEKNPQLKGQPVIEAPSAKGDPRFEAESHEEDQPSVITAGNSRTSSTSNQDILKSAQIAIASSQTAIASIQTIVTVVSILVAAISAGSFVLVLLYRRKIEKTEGNISELVNEISKLQATVDDIRLALQELDETRNQIHVALEGILKEKDSLRNDYKKIAKLAEALHAAFLDALTWRFTDYWLRPAITPPSTFQIAPVTQLASAESRNTITDATSIGFPIRPIG